MAPNPHKYKLTIEYDGTGCGCWRTPRRSPHSALRPPQVSSWPRSSMRGIAWRPLPSRRFRFCWGKVEWFNVRHSARGMNYLDSLPSYF